ncbi:MAG: hypothetical protein JWQ92_3320 [Amnibacterium sp.]|nr:hypothetical protein [Amnibacterium sp.]
MLADRLGRVREQRAAIAAALDGLLSADARDGLVRRDEELAALERGLGVLLPTAWDLQPGAPRAVVSGEDAEVLADIRVTASVLALRLQERPGPRSPLEEQDLAAAVALFRFAHTALGDDFGGFGSFGSFPG